MANLIQLSNATQISNFLLATRDGWAVEQPSGGTQGTVVVDVGYTIGSHTASSTVFAGKRYDANRGEFIYDFKLVNGGTVWYAMIPASHLLSIYWVAADTIGVGIVSGAVSAGSGFIEGAAVTLTKGAYSQATTSAATTGAYSFTGVPQDTGYTVTCTLAGYTGASASVNVTENTTTTQNLTLVEYGSIAGTCKDDAAADLDGASVTITKGAFSTAVTSASGAYEILSVPADTGYTLTVQKENYVTGSYTVDITEATQTTQNVVADRYGGISGTITDEDGNVSGATINVYADGDAGGSVLYTTTTGVDGTYSITTVEPATYDLQASKTNYVTLDIGDVVVAAATVTTGTDGVLVQYADYSGVIDDGSNPLAGADVAFYVTYPGTAAYVTQSAETTGAWAITGIEPGTYQFRVYKIGYTPKFVADRVIAGDEDVTTDDHSIAIIP